MNEICAYFTSKSFTDELRLLQEGYSSAFAFFEKKNMGEKFSFGSSISILDTIRTKNAIHYLSEKNFSNSGPLAFRFIQV